MAPEAPKLTETAPRTMAGCVNTDTAAAPACSSMGGVEVEMTQRRWGASVLLMLPSEHEHCCDKWPRSLPPAFSSFAVLRTLPPSPATNATPPTHPMHTQCT